MGSYSPAGGGYPPDNVTTDLNSQQQMEVNATGIAGTGLTVLNNLLNVTSLAGSLIRVANSNDAVLSNTNPNVVATFTPLAKGNFILNSYIRVITATTTVTLTAQWTDASGNQSYTWLAGAGQAIGVIMLVPLYINAINGSAVSITATAGTANQVYVSATITRVT